jgi:rRNA-processing protein CGR1
VSGRSWKVRPQRKATTLVSSRANGRCKDWSSRVAERGERRQLLDLQKEIRQAKEDEARLKRERRLENETRRQENELRNLEKSKAVKALNHGKAHLTIKAMNKKQLRQIKKSRLNPRTGVVEYVSAYAK